MSKKEQIVKLKILESRILKWREIGPACTEKEWDNMNKDLAVVGNFIRALERRPEKNRIHKTHGKMLNTMWHLYATKQGKGLDDLMGGVDWSQEVHDRLKI